MFWKIAYCHPKFCFVPLRKWLPDACTQLIVYTILVFFSHFVLSRVVVFNILMCIVDYSFICNAYCAVLGVCSVNLLSSCIHLYWLCIVVLKSSLSWDIACFPWIFVLATSHFVHKAASELNLIYMGKRKVFVETTTYY